MNAHASQPLPHASREEHGIVTSPAALNTPPPVGYKPAILHQQHPDSKLCENFHWVPYPLGLMPYDSWHKLHHRDDVQPALSFRCPVCRQERKVPAHVRKVFLVAERMAWDEKLVSIHDKDLNEELNWKVNYELGIMDPFVEDPEQVLGGKNSRNNKFYPYQNEHETKLALKLIFMTEDITETTWALWIGTQMDLQKMLVDGIQGSSPTASQSTCSQGWHQKTSDSTSGRQKTPERTETVDQTLSPDFASTLGKGKSHELPTPASSLPKVTHGAPDRSTVQGADNRAPSSATLGSTPTTLPLRDLPRPQRIQSYKSLQDFYSLLDKIERTSYVGALFLEAYAEKLRDDMCKSCWLKHNINLDLF